MLFFLAPIFVLAGFAPILGLLYLSPVAFHAFAKSLGHLAHLEIGGPKITIYDEFGAALRGMTASSLSDVCSPYPELLPLCRPEDAPTEAMAAISGLFALALVVCTLLLIVLWPFLVLPRFRLLGHFWNQAKVQCAEGLGAETASEIPSVVQEYKETLLADMPWLTQSLVTDVQVKELTTKNENLKADLAEVRKPQIMDDAVAACLLKETEILEREYSAAKKTAQEQLEHYNDFRRQKDSLQSQYEEQKTLSESRLAQIQNLERKNRDLQIQQHTGETATQQFLTRIKDLEREKDNAHGKACASSQAQSAADKKVRDLLAQTEALRHQTRILEVEKASVEEEAARSKKLHELYLTEIEGLKVEQGSLQKLHSSLSDQYAEILSSRDHVSSLLAHEENEHANTSYKLQTAEIKIEELGSQYAALEKERTADKKLHAGQVSGLQKKLQELQGQLENAQKESCLQQARLIAERKKTKRLQEENNSLRNACFTFTNSGEVTQATSSKELVDLLSTDAVDESEHAERARAPSVSSPPSSAGVSSSTSALFDIDRPCFDNIRTAYSMPLADRWAATESLELLLNPDIKRVERAATDGGLHTLWFDCDVPSPKFDRAAFNLWYSKACPQVVQAYHDDCAVFQKHAEEVDRQIAEAMQANELEEEANEEPGLRHQSDEVDAKDENHDKGDTVTFKKKNNKRGTRGSKEAQRERNRRRLARKRAAAEAAEQEIRMANDGQPEQQRKLSQEGSNANGDIRPSQLLIITEEIGEPPILVQTGPKTAAPTSNVSTQASPETKPGVHPSNAASAPSHMKSKTVENAREAHGLAIGWREPILETGDFGDSSRFSGSEGTKKRIRKHRGINTGRNKRSQKEEAALELVEDEELAQKLADYHEAGPAPTVGPSTMAKDEAIAPSAPTMAVVDKESAATGVSRQIPSRIRVQTGTANAPPDVNESSDTAPTSTTAPSMPGSADQEIKEVLAEYEELTKDLGSVKDSRWASPTSPSQPAAPAPPPPPPQQADASAAHNDTQSRTVSTLTTSRWATPTRSAQPRRGTHQRDQENRKTRAAIRGETDVHAAILEELKGKMGM